MQRNGTAPAALAASDQQGAGRDVYVPPFQSHGLADTQPGSPHDERRHPGAAKPQGRQGIQKPLDLLRVPVVRNRQMGTFGVKVPIWSNSEAARKAELAARQRAEGRPAARNRIKTVCEGRFQ